MIILLRLIKDVNDVGLDDLTQRAFQDAGFPEIDAYFGELNKKWAAAIKTAGS